MKRPPAYWKRAKIQLYKKDSVLRKIIKKYNKGFLTTKNNPFLSLCRTIVGQQISTRAADSIWAKFEKKCKKNIKPRANFEDGRMSVILAETANKSLKTKKFELIKF